MSKRPRPEPTGSPVEIAFWGVSLCFLLSGVAALVYQMVWMRYLSTIFGTSELAIVTVLVAYMGGLAVGAALASRLVKSLRHPIRLYAILEGVIALSALLVPLVLKGAGRLHAAILGGQANPPSDGGVGEALAFLGLGSLVLLIPTACMGATLPILAAGVVRRAGQIGKRVGWLYALNTAGAVFGTVLAAFFLIPRLGLWQTSFVGVALNLTVAFLGWFVALRSDDPDWSDDSDESGRSAPAAAPSTPFVYTILVLMLVSGALSFAYEVLWSRLLSHVLGGSLYAFATMLAAFLGGIALGGLAGARLAANRRRSCFWLAGVEIATGLLTAFLFLYVSSTGFADTNWGDASLGSLATLCAFLLMPATLCIGATFPLAVRSLTEDPREAGRSAGRVYSWNTIGAILGAVGAGYFLIPALGFAQTFKWAIAGNLALGALVLYVMTPRMRVPAVIAGVLALACALFFHPGPPLRLLTMSPGAGPTEGDLQPDLIHHAVGHSASVTVLERSGSFLVRTNGLPEAEVFAKGAEKLSYTSIRWLPALPKVLRPETASMLVVGFGGGALLEAVPRGIKSIDVVELEAEVIRANKLIAKRRAIDPFQDPRIEVIVNDVRGALRLTDKRYDTIVSQPSHPWTAGASHLYTREFLQLARTHLNEKGTFVQWLGAHFVDEDLLRSFCATFVSVFPHSHLYLVSDNFVFVGSESSLEDSFLSGARPGGTLMHLSDYAKISNVEDVLAVLQLDEAGCRGLAGDHPVITDDRNLMATHQALGGRQSGSMNERENLKRVITPLHYLNQDEPVLLENASGDPVDFVYLARLLASSAQHVDLSAFRAKSLPTADQLILQAQSVQGRSAQQALALLQQAIALHPESRQARAIDAQIRIVLARRSWMSRGLGPSPHEFADLIANDQSLQDDLRALTPQHRLIVEAEHWVLTGQVARARVLEREKLILTDHRDPFFQTAAQVRLACLLDATGKAEEAAEADAREAADLLDHLLSLTLVSNLTFAKQRIALAQRFGDTGYQVAAGWIMARRLASAPPNAPESMKDLYRAPLGEILKPHVERDGRGRMKIKDPDIRDFYGKVRNKVGEHAFPAEYRR